MTRRTGQARSNPPAADWIHTWRRTLASATMPTLLFRVTKVSLEDSENDEETAPKRQCTDLHLTARSRPNEALYFASSQRIQES